MYHPAGHAHAAHTYLSSFLVPGQPTGESPNSVFTDLVADLTEAVTGPLLAAELTKELGVTLDADAFVAPTSFVQMEIKVSTAAPTSAPAVMPLPTNPKSDGRKIWEATNIHNTRHCLCHAVPVKMTRTLVNNTHPTEPFLRPPPTGRPGPRDNHHRDSRDYPCSGYCPRVCGLQISAGK